MPNLRIAGALLLFASGAFAPSNGEAQLAPAAPGQSMSAAPSAAARKSSPATRARKRPAPEPPAAAPEPPAPPLRPSQMPPVPPQVHYSNGMLTIAAENCTLADILTAIRTQIGAAMDVPPSAAGERVAVHLGPGSPRDVVAALLNGSSFNYVIVGMDQDPSAIRRLIVSQRGAEGAVSGASVNPLRSAVPARSPLPGMTAPADEDAEAADQPEDARPGQPRVQAPNPGAAVPAPAAPGAPSFPGGPPNPLGIRPNPETAAPGANPNSPPAVKTPEQLLEELKRMQQQQQTPPRPPPAQ